MIGCLPNSICLSLGFCESIIELTVCEISGLFELIVGSTYDYLSHGTGCGSIMGR
jgi:hypothetical protein